MLRELIERLLTPNEWEEWDSSDRRQKLRARVNFALDVIFPTSTWVGLAMDIGPTGIQVRIPNDRTLLLKKEQPLQLKYVPPYFTGLHTIDCKIQWLRRGPKHILLGLLFDDSSHNLRRSWVPGIITEALHGNYVSERKQLRVPTAIETRFEVEERECNGLLCDLSASGGLLETKENLREGTRVDLVLMFGPPRGPTEVEAVVCRNQPIRGGRYRLGLSFLIDAQRKKFLQQLVKALVALQKSKENVAEVGGKD